MSEERRDVAMAERLVKARDSIRRQLGAVIIGQETVVEEVLGSQNPSSVTGARLRNHATGEQSSVPLTEIVPRLKSS